MENNIGNIGSDIVKDLEWQAKEFSLCTEES